MRCPECSEKLDKGHRGTLCPECCREAYRIYFSDAYSVECVRCGSRISEDGSGLCQACEETDQKLRDYYETSGGWSGEQWRSYGTISWML